MRRGLHSAHPFAARCFLFLVMVGCWLSVGIGASLAEEESRSWQGNWNNRKFGTSGALQCTATTSDGKKFEAQFRATFRGKESTYNVTMTGTKKSERVLLEGTATIGGDSYRWNGYIEGKTLFGNFRSNSGNNGTFKLDQK